MNFSHLKLIEEVKKRPELYSNERVDREEKIRLWKEVGAAIFSDWNQLNKAAAYDRVLFIQKKWRSFRDAYLREVRAQKTGIRPNRTVYKYFKPLLFLGGFDGNPDEIADREYITPKTDATEDGESSYDPLITATSKSAKKKPKKHKIEQESLSTNFDDDESDNIEDEVEVPVYSLDIDSDTDNDRLFLLSFLPEMKQLPINIKMWARAQIANIMQEAINSQFNNTMPGKGHKRTRKDSSE